MCVCVHMSVGALRVQKKVQIWNIVSCPVWVLKTELRCLQEQSTLLKDEPSLAQSFIFSYVSVSVYENVCVSAGAL